MSLDSVEAAAPAGASSGRVPDGPVLCRHLSVSHLLLAVGAWATLRLLGLAVVQLSRDRPGRSLVGLLTSYDAEFYLRIAEVGYDRGPEPDGSGGLTRSNLAFHPLMPMLIRLFMEVGVPTRTAGLVVAGLTGLVAAAAIYRCGEVLYGPRIGVLLVLLWGTLPHAVVQAMAYTESLFTAIAAMLLVSLLRRRWLSAALWCIAAGLTRPTATALVGTVGLVAIVAVCRRQDGWRPWVAMLMAPVGLLGYWLWVALRVDRADGWFWLQYGGWRTHFDGGRATVGQLVVGFIAPPLPGYLVTSVVVVLFGALTALLVAHRQAPLPVTAFSVLLFLLVVGSAGSYHSKGRLLVPGFTTLIPLAAALVSARVVTMFTTLAVLTLTSILYGGYLLTAWPLSP